MAFRKILITVDDDPLAAHAAEVGIALARSLNADVALIHAIDPSLIYSPEAGSVADDIAQHAQQEGARVVADFRARLPAGTSVLQFVRQGRPGQEIVKAAREWPADLIVIGSHGRRGLSRAVLGSVAEEVMRHSPCPVLVVRRA
ncbi:Nucleotide-binding universal stress protein, UspA family [Enhydrobacter aerosaccus]|uniref:Universal stress protein n=1 Tax=Enhydrobacter aerosaccus TaxID=225324 RepID=A0A1T4TK88_9HYPH|nr:universal stress protein [Enhydrobacter aerosaccus]SKA40880.1 Nucleotide-binding universal stress protein, UspA family [Enhydrobacter aerosaccus]